LDIYSQGGGKAGIKSMLGINEGRDSSGLLSFSHSMKSNCRFARSLRPENFHDSSLRKATYSKGYVKGEYSCGDDFHSGSEGFPKSHYGTFAELAPDIFNCLFENIFPCLRGFLLRQTEPLLSF
jgi:hypothetical protein